MKSLPIIRFRTASHAALCAVFALSAALFLAGNARAQNPGDLFAPRYWTSQSGTRVAAKFVRLDGNQVVLENRQGQPFRIRRDFLSDADRALLDAEFGPETPVAEPSPAFPDTPVAPSASGAAADSFEVAGHPVRPGEKTVFLAPLDEEGIKDLRKNGALTRASVGLWLPPDFDPSRPWKILLVSQTSDGRASSVEHMDCYLDAAREVGGWIVMAADGETKAPEDSHDYRWATMHAGLLALEAQWPAARSWPVAAAGFSGGAKRSGYMAARLLAEEYPLIGMWMGGCNDDMASKGLALYRPSRQRFIKVPIFLSTGDTDPLANPEKTERVRRSMDQSGFKTIRVETYSGAHSVHSPHIADGLRWFDSMSAGNAPSAPGIRRPLRPGFP